MYISEIYKVIIILIIIPAVSANIFISEIMYDPAGSDTGREWIEIYSDGACANLSNYKLYENNVNHGLTLINGTFTLCNNEYAVIADNYISFLEEYNFTGNLYDSTFSLSNTNETLIIKNTTTIFDNATYYNTQGAEGNGKALCRTITSFIECEPTPGKENIFVQPPSLEILQINEFFPDPEGADDAPMPGGEFIEIYNPNSYDIDLTNYKLYDEYGHMIIITDTNTLSGAIIKSNDYLAIYMNGFFGLLNNEGYESIRLYNNNNQLMDTVTYASTEEALSWSKVNNIWNLRIPSPNEENNKDEPRYRSSLEIINIYVGTDNKAKFGDNLRAKINVYKGNTTKNSVKLYIPDLTKETRTNLYNKFTNYTLTLSVQIEPNCNENLKDGKYNLILKGLDQETQKEIEIGGITSSLCQEIKQNATKKITYEIIGYPSQKESEIISKVKLVNNEPEKTTYTIWSYASKGNSVITGDQYENIQTIELPKESSIDAELRNNIEPDVESGTYDYKIKLLKEGRKTPVLIESTINIKNDLHSESIINKKPQEITGKVIYSSSSIDSQRTGIFIFSALLLVVIIAISLKK